jgi:hypothetical protein
MTRIFSDVSVSHGHGEARGGVRSAPPPPGLVLSSTSQKSFSDFIDFDPVAARNNRMRRGIINSARLIQNGLIDQEIKFRAAMLTLTYAQDKIWSPKDISRLLDHVRKYAKRSWRWTLPYVVKLELTKAGVPHYHVLLWLPRGCTLPKPDKQGWWPHGLTRIEWAYRPVGYIAKYAGKDEYGALPKGARLWACGGLTKQQRAILFWRLAPSWFRGFVPEGSRCARRSGSWWENISAGIRYRSPWVLDREFGSAKLRLRWRGWSLDDVVFV